MSHLTLNDIPVIARALQFGNATKLSNEKSALKVNINVGKRDAPAARRLLPKIICVYLQKESAKKSNEKLIFFDFETDQSTGEHIVNFVVSQYLDGTEFVCEGFDAIEQFCRYLFSPQHKGFTAIADNMKGLDGQSILRWILERSQCPRVISNGSKIICVT
ncbi:DNA_pol_B_2 domain-containing protein [Trichonephila clavata]|uniref:DNA_pol_B_2 domain-containing protein n=1 Tax=Trichonephila clavata TaxID=2740835 RepID=A0A8X6J021_TRICU|nr:DNA_pol_B_2 domain-containing protein [Trichonephila clavata]